MTIVVANCSVNVSRTPLLGLADYEASPAETPLQMRVLIYRKTGNLRAVQLLLGHTKVDSTVHYLGVELEDALSIKERIDI